MDTLEPGTYRLTTHDGTTRDVVVAGTSRLDSGDELHLRTADGSIETVLVGHATVLVDEYGQAYRLGGVRLEDATLMDGDTVHDLLRNYLSRFPYGAPLDSAMGEPDGSTSQAREDMGSTVDTDPEPPNGQPKARANRARSRRGA